MVEEIADLWRAHHKQKERLDEVRAVVMGVDGANGLRSKVAGLETRVHAIEDRPLSDALDREKKLKKWAVSIGAGAVSAVLMVNAQDIVKAIIEAIK